MKQITMSAILGRRSAGVFRTCDGADRSHPIAMGGWFASGQQSVLNRAGYPTEVDDRRDGTVNSVDATETSSAPAERGY
jgi:hypothetical protein